MQSLRLLRIVTLLWRCEPVCFLFCFICTNIFYNKIENVVYNCLGSL